MVNAGIAGNRIQKPYPAATLFPGEGHMFGIAGVDRFEQDVYDGASPDIVFVMEGVNDCTHSHGSRVYVSTISPLCCLRRKLA